MSIAERFSTWRKTCLVKDVYFIQSCQSDKLYDTLSVRVNVLAISICVIRAFFRPELKSFRFFTILLLALS